MEMILITRFAIELKSSSKFFETREGIEWFIHRLSFFKKTCLPSVINQEILPDLWLIFMSENKSLHTQLSNETLGFDFIKIIQISQFKAFNEVVSEYLTKHNRSRSITTRLDCDDALFPKYIKTVKSISEKKSSDCLFEPTKGLCIQVENDTITRAAYIQKLLPPFLSFINRTGDNIHVFSFNHDEWPKVFITEKQNKTPLWIQIVHENNISNQFGWGWMVKSVVEINPEGIQYLFKTLDVVKTSSFKLIKVNVRHYLCLIQGKFYKKTGKRISLKIRKD
jgi:hypothetical protein